MLRPTEEQILSYYCLPEIQLTRSALQNPQFPLFTLLLPLHPSRSPDCSVTFSPRASYMDTKILPGSISLYPKGLLARRRGQGVVLGMNSLPRRCYYPWRSLLTHGCLAPWAGSASGAMRLRAPSGWLSSSILHSIDSLLGTYDVYFTLCALG